MEFQFQNLRDESARGTDVASEIREFCLKIIKDFYGIDYTKEWHADLDSLLLDGDGNWFSRENRGSFYHVRDGAGAIIATGGVYDLKRKPSTRQRIAKRYGDDAEICQIVRVYLDPDFRGAGLGSQIATRLERDALSLEYDVAYLHADARAPKALSFWKKCGYSDFGSFSYLSKTGMDTSVDFEKLL